MELHFSKYQGTGNDFVIIDNRDGLIFLKAETVKLLCDRKFGIGGDGLMLLNSRDGYDFEMKYFNSDGNEGTMCGNGGRCLTQFAYDSGIKKDKFLFIAIDGEHQANINENWINLKMKDVDTIEEFEGGYILNTGSPHFVKPVDDVMNENVYEVGHELRYSERFMPDGINVNFVESPEDGEIIVRTYERGVEAETLSCGTGVTASAIVFAQEGFGFNRLDVTTLGGKLAVEFYKTESGKFDNIWLCGPAKFVFKGVINV